MTHTEQQQRAFYRRTGLSFTGMSFEKAMSIPAIRIDAITKGGKMIQSVPIKPNDLIVVPESFF